MKYTIEERLPSKYVEEVVKNNKFGYFLTATEKAMKQFIND